VAQLRMEMGITQEQLAQAADVSRQTIVAIEGGTYSPSTVLALRLSLLLDVPVNALFMLPGSAEAEIVKQRLRLLEASKKDDPPG
jgi:putative transcriptional regulator